MKTALIAIVFLLIGGAVGGFLALGFGAGMGAGAGIVVGSQAGACLAMESAKDQGLLSAEQIDQVLAGAIGKIKSKAELPPDAEPQWVGTAADCAAMIAELGTAAQSQQ
jgi:hypothetical protein